jgi:hypothetical protein
MFRHYNTELTVVVLALALLKRIALSVLAVLLRDPFLIVADDVICDVPSASWLV